MNYNTLGCKEGDKVRIIRPNSQWFGKIGIIERMCDFGCHVWLDIAKYDTFESSELKFAREYDNEEDI
jgi:hypothetical protein